VKGWKPYSVATNKTGNKINSSSKNKNTTSTEDVDSCNIVQMSTEDVDSFNIVQMSTEDAGCDSNN